MVLYGESRTGKTLWARSLGKHTYSVGLLNNTDLLTVADVDYAVFDDLRGGFKFFPAFKEWLGCQQTVTVAIKYREPQLVTWGKPAIYISNSDPRDELGKDDHAWLEANCDFIYVDRPIFRASNSTHQN